MKSLPLVVVNSMFVGKEPQYTEGGTEMGADFNQGNEIHYARFLLKISTKHTTNRHIPFLGNFHSKQNFSDLTTLQDSTRNSKINTLLNIFPVS